MEGISYRCTPLLPVRSINMPIRALGRDAAYMSACLIGHMCNTLYKQIGSTHLTSPYNPTLKLSVWIEGGPQQKVAWGILGSFAF